MRIAIPVVEGKLSMHFGHCQKFVIMEVDKESCKIIAEEEYDAPPHEPGLLPRWLAEKNANLIIAGGMGQRAQTLFQENNIEVIVGAESKAAREIIDDYLQGNLTPGQNFCDH
jgi:predicted Fe-Mo cluster-binding NifX family protein